MRLSETSKAILIGNIEFIKYCRECGISLEKMDKCNIEKMGDTYVFVLCKNNIPKANSDILLDLDIETQPDIVLIMEYDKESKVFKFETTEFTKRVLNR